MAAHRFYRLNVDLTYQSYVQLAGIEMFDAGGVNRATVGNCTLLTTLASGSAANLFDSDNGTAAAFAADATIDFDFGVGISHDIVTFTIRNSAAASGTVIDGTIYASDDGTTWIQYGIFSGRDTSLGAFSSHTLAPPAVGTFDLAILAANVASFAGATAAFFVPSIVVASLASPPPIAMPPMVSVAAYSGGLMSIAGPSPQMACAGHDSAGENAFSYTAPRPVIAAATGAGANAIGVACPTLAASGTVTALISANLSAPAATVSAQATASGVAAVAGRPLAATLIGYSGAVCSVTLTGKATLQATGKSGGIASAIVACPLFEMVASGASQNHGGADLLAPSPRLGAQAQAWLAPPAARLTAIGVAVIEPHYEAYAVNLKHNQRGGNDAAPTDEVTRYTNFPFTHIVRYQNSYFGANTTGLYLLDGTTDDGDLIAWSFKSAMTDFDSSQKKIVAAGYFSGRIGPTATVQLIAGEQDPVTYDYGTPRDASAQNHRQLFGKGVRERYYAFGMSGDDRIELDEVEFDVHNLSRKI